MRPKSYCVISFVLFAAAVFAQQTPPAPAPSQAKSDDALELVKQGQKLVSDGKLDEGMALYQRASQQDPKLYQAQVAMGAALDLQGKYSEARDHIAKGIEMAPDQAQPLRVMAVSYAFECNIAKAAEYERKAFDLQYKAQKAQDAAGTADELARIYLECGDYDNAFQWYQTGHLTALQDAKLTPAEKDLWEFRWEAALARIWARRGDAGRAKEHLAAAKTILDKKTNPEQARFYPYLAGYVELYTGDYKAALADLQKADQKDPFVVSLLAQAYEKTGDKPKAVEYYKESMTFNSHAPTNAFARRTAKEKLAALSAAPLQPANQ